MYRYLFTPGKINRLELKNRIVMLPMLMAYAEQDNTVSVRDEAFYRARAEGGAGLIIVPAAVSDRGRLPGMHGLWKDDFVPGLQRLADVIHDGGSRFFLQLFHCGRNGNRDTLGGLDPWGPSAIPSPIYKGEVTAMSLEQIGEAERMFADAAVRAKRAGADGVEISGTVGYLLAQFMSPLTNVREDAYGGSEENRLRFPLEIVRSVRQAVGCDFPMGIRISGAQMMEGGYDITCMQRFCARLEEEGLVDYVSVTGGWHESPVPLVTYHVPEGAYACMADAIRRVVTVPVMMSNRINSGEAAEELLRKGIVDFAGVARGFLADAAFAEHLRTGKAVNQCQGCNRGCIEAIFARKPVSCAFNPDTGMEYLENRRPRREKGQKVLVIGGGPAGMEAAAKAAERGCAVTLVTREKKLGGQLNLACLPPRKEDLAVFREYMIARLHDLGVRILTETEADEDLIRACSPDLAVLATGSEPKLPDVPGIERALTARDVLTAEGERLAALRRGSTVIVGGGATGLDTAHFLAMSGFAGAEAKAFVDSRVPESMGSMYVPCDITCIEAAPKAGTALRSLRRLVMGELSSLGIKFRTDTALAEIGEGWIQADTPEGRIRMPADHVVVAMGMRPSVPPITETLSSMKIPYTVLGDAEKPGDIMHALQDAWKWSLEIPV